MRSQAKVVPMLDMFIDYPPPQHHHRCDRHHSDGDGDFLWQLYTFPDKRLYRVKECEPGGYLGSKRGHHSGIPTAFD